LPDLRGPARRHRVGELRSGQRPSLRALRDPFRLRAGGRLCRRLEHEGNRPEHGVDADGLTLACATAAERRAARRSGARAALLGLAGRNGIPEGPLVSFGLAGGLGEELACGEVVDATRVVDAAGTTLWEGGPIGVPGARTGTILAAGEIVDDPEAR